MGVQFRWPIRSVVFIIGKFGLALARFKAHSPVYLAGLLLLFSGMSSLFLGKLLISWVIYFLFLVFLGGVIVVVLFIVSICNNEKFIFYPTSHPELFLVLLFGLLFFNSSEKLSGGISQFQLSYTLYDRSNTAVFMYLMLFLLLCLVRVVRVTKKEYGPLVKRLLKKKKSPPILKEKKKKKKKKKK